MEAGHSAFDASLQSAKEISFTILAMTLSLAAVFIPLVFMSGLMGRIFREFSITIVISILASGVVSLTLTPLMTSRLLSNRGEGREEDLDGARLRRHRTPRPRCLRALAVVLSAPSLDLRRHLGRLPRGTGYLFYVVPKAFLPVGDSSFIRGVLVAQEGSSPDQMHAYQTRSGEDHEGESRRPQHVHHERERGVSSARTRPSSSPSSSHPHSARPIEQVAGQLMGGIASTIPGRGRVPPAEPGARNLHRRDCQRAGPVCLSRFPASIPMRSTTTAGKMMAKMHEYPGFLFVNSDLYNHTPKLAGRHSARSGEALRRLRDPHSDAPARCLLAELQLPDQEGDGPIPGDPGSRRRSSAPAPEDLGKLYIKSDDGQRMVPLNAVTSWHPVIGPQAVNHINQFTSVTMFFNLKPGFAIGPATQFVRKTAKQILPPGVQGALQGEALTFQNTVCDLAILMLVAVFVMYVILAILYESYLHPITVLSSLPVALLGGLLTLWIFGAEASLYAYIGMFMLMGIVKKNGIMIVDFAEQRVRQGIADDQAIHDASMERFRPIMMTTAAALLGAMPIALGYGADGSSRRPLGLVVVGGLIVSQFITLFVTPAIYLYLEEFQEKVLDRFSFFRSPREARRRRRSRIRAAGRTVEINP